MRKKRNVNKDRDDAAPAASGSRRTHTNKSTIAIDDVDSDTESAVSHLSLDEDLQSVVGDASADSTITENDESMLQDKLGEYLDNAAHKNSSVRLAALKNVQVLLTRHFMPDVIDKWKLTIVDVVEKSLKRSSTDESTVAAIICAILGLQLGSDIAESMIKLLDIVRCSCGDSSVAEEHRSICALVLGLCGYLCVDEVESLRQSIHCLRDVWSGLKANRMPPPIALFTNAVTAWALLLEQTTGNGLETALNTDLPKLCTFLDCNQVDMRIAAGETLTVLYELGAGLYNDINYHPPNHHHTIDILESLATDSLKYRAKRDRRVQRFNFRQIHTAIKEKVMPSIVIKFNEEHLELDSPFHKLLYDMSCQILRGGMNWHLKQNLLLREIFQLGPPIVGNADNKLSKSQKVSMQNAISKARTLQRGKQRDKRHAAF